VFNKGSWDSGKEDIGENIESTSGRIKPSYQMATRRENQESGMIGYGNPTTESKGCQFRKSAQKIANREPFDPPELAKLESGMYVPHDGHHRIEAYKKSGMNFIPLANVYSRKLSPQQKRRLDKLDETIEEDHFMQQSPWDFDQSQSGWRSIQNPQARIRALVAYLRMHTSGNVWKRDCPQGEKKVPPQILLFHLGQLYAMEADYSKAIKCFEKAKDEDQQWNNYVLATIAFLRGDRQVFEKYSSGENYNEDTLKRLSDNWGKPYSEAY